MKELQWQNINNAIHMVPETLVDWVFDPGSFVRGLKQHGVLSPQIKVLQQSWQLPTPEERHLLGVSVRTYVLIREVLIKSDEGVWMFARTVFPKKTLTGKEQCLSRLKNRSLGSVLFKNPNLLRSEFAIACIRPEEGWHNKIKCHLPLSNHSLWARRSLFYIKEKSLLLTEVFLPDLTELSGRMK